jgi:hypothetical protein
MKPRRPKGDKCPRCGSRHVSVEKADEGHLATCRDCKKVFVYTGTVYFQGEMMTCGVCGKQQQSDPNVNSDWRLLELDGEKFYACTDHFPPDEGATQKDYAAAYESILRLMMDKRAAQ